MFNLEKVPRRRTVDFIHATGNLRIVDSILAIPPGLTIEEVNPIIERSHRFDIPPMLTAMVTQVDASGLTPNFVGVDRSLLNSNFCRAACNAQDVLLELVRLGEEKLSEVRNFPTDLQKDIFDTLDGGKCTLRTLSILDQMQGDIITRLRLIRKTSPIALAIRQANEKSLFDLYANPDNRRVIISQLNPHTLGHKNIRDCLEEYFSQPRVTYTTTNEPDGRVSHIRYTFYIPNIFKVRLGKDFHNASVGELVENITPDIYRKYEGEHIHFDPKTPLGFIALLRDFGAPFPRIIAEQIKADENLRMKLFTEQENLATIIDYFESR